MEYKGIKVDVSKTKNNNYVLSAGNIMVFCDEVNDKMLDKLYQAYTKGVQ